MKFQGRNGRSVNLMIKAKQRWSWKRKPIATNAHRLSATGKIEKLVLFHNHNDSNAKTKNKVEKTREARMKTAQRLRAMAALCRQSAALHPDRSWRLLAEAEYWEHLAATALSPDTEQGDLAAA